MKNFASAAKCERNNEREQESERAVLGSGEWGRARERDANEK